jgi:hypothetical protein
MCAVIEPSLLPVHGELGMNSPDSLTDKKPQVSGFLSESSKTCSHILGPVFTIVALHIQTESLEVGVVDLERKRHGELNIATASMPLTGASLD